MDTRFAPTAVVARQYGRNVSAIRMKKGVCAKPNATIMTQRSPWNKKDWKTILDSISSPEDSDAEDELNVMQVQRNARRVGGVDAPVRSRVGRGQISPQETHLWG